MRFRNLKTHIAVDLAFLLLTAICVTDFLLIRIIEQQLLEGRFASTREWILSSAEPENRFLDWQNPGSDHHLKLSVDHEIDSGEIVYAVFQNNGHERIIGSVSKTLRDSIDRLIHETVHTGKPGRRFIGESWGVFWKRSKYLIISIPLPDRNGAAAAVLNLELLYRQLRESQQMALIFLFINFFLLFCLGFHRLTRHVSRPIHRIIKLTDAFQPSDQIELFPERQNDDFGRLSSALNRMLQRIDQDQNRLRQSFDSLERANFQLQQARQETVRAEKLASIGRLSAGIAHEIGNPTGIVLGYLGLLRTGSIQRDDTIGMDYITRAESEINRINVIIRQLLDFSRVTAEDFSNISTHDLMREVGDMLSMQSLMENIRINYALSAQNDQVHADYNQLCQVLVNLLINAADSIAESGNYSSGKIDLITRNLTAPPSLQLSIEDNGCGIPEDCLEKIFDPFFTTKAPGKGTGLGLSVSYRIIERLGGTIEAQSTPGKGTAMVITLPLAITLMQARFSQYDE